MRIQLTFDLYETIAVEDLDELCDLIREAVDEKIGETEYMVQDIGIGIELFD